MLADFIESFILGFAITAVPGAVLFEVVRRCLSVNSSVTRFLLGNFAGMALVISFAFLGLNFITKDVVADLLLSLSGVLLIYIGVSAIRQNPDAKNAKVSQKSAFGAGFVLAAANPLSILFWISLTGRFMKESQSLSITLLLVLSVMCGSLLLFFILILAMRTVKTSLSAVHMKYMSIIFGLIITTYGVITLLKIFQ